VSVTDSSHSKFLSAARITDSVEHSYIAVFRWMHNKQAYTIALLNKI